MLRPGALIKPTGPLRHALSFLHRGGLQKRLVNVLYRTCRVGSRILPQCHSMSMARTYPSFSDLDRRGLGAEWSFCTTLVSWADLLANRDWFPPMGYPESVLLQQRFNFPRTQARVVLSCRNADIF